MCYSVIEYASILCINNIYNPSNTLVIFIISFQIIKLKID